MFFIGTTTNGYGNSFVHVYSFVLNLIKAIFNEIYFYFKFLCRR